MCFFLYIYHILAPLLRSQCGRWYPPRLISTIYKNITSLRDTLNPFPKFYNQNVHVLSETDLTSNELNRDKWENSASIICSFGRRLAIKLHK